MNNLRKTDRDSRVEISVVVPVHNEEESISECLHSLLAVDYSQDKYEVIVIDDGSTDGTGDVVRAFTEKHPNVVLISKEHKGRASALNFGLKYAKGKFVLVTDADATIPPDWLTKMASELRQVDVIVGGYYLSSVTSRLEKIQNAYCLIIFKYGGIKGIPRSGINMGFSKAVANNLDGFNEHIKSGAGEFVERAQKKGYKARFNPDIAVQTRGTLSFTEFIKQKLRWREYPLYILTNKVKLTKSGLLGIGYTDGLSFILFALTILAIITQDFRYFLVSFVSILLLDILLYIKPIWRMSKDKKDKNYALYFVMYSVLIMLVRLALIPYLAYCLVRGSKPTFEAKRA